MNYLGHLYLSGNDTSLMQANLYGDFIKGSNLSDLDPEIEKGIRLHRAIDHFIDNHKAVHELLPVLRTDLPKVAGIAIDIYFDHLLAKNWQTFHPQPYADYLDVVYQSLNSNDKRYNTDYLLFLERLLQYRWINHYPNLDAVDRMSKNISSQLSFPNQLLHGKSVFLIHEKTITEAFFDYMRSANEHFLTEKLRILS
ncbi:MAG TPA: ACP phosphodiesterase [Fluviicola sp.]|nr:ACP phosphodiesterase [Fluviicola sp.]